MIGLDTNILIRHLAQDDEIQSKIAGSYIAGFTAENTAFINKIVMCELVWVMESGYKRNRIQIADILEDIMQIAQFTVEDCDNVRRAIGEYKYKNIDFSDALLAFGNKAAGCKKTVTFDKKAAKISEFELLLPAA